jgi:hypothetical protein
MANELQNKVGVITLPPSSFADVRMPVPSETASSYPILWVA